MSRHRTRLHASPHRWCGPLDSPQAGLDNHRASVLSSVSDEALHRLPSPV